MYGDTLVNVDLQRFVSHHTPGTAVTLLVHPNDHPQDSDLVEMDEENRIVAFHSYPHARDANLGNLVNAALYVFSKDCLGSTAERGDIAKDLFPALLRDGKTFRGYRSREYIKDAGTPERLEKVRRDYESKLVEAAVLDRPMPAVFMDRDGTLNYDHGWLRSAGNLELLPDVEEAVRTVNQSGRLAVLVTNQPVVARGECTEEDLRRIHNRLEWLLGQKGAYLDGIYYCPHHPDAGFPGERLDLKVACSCRKPETGMMEAAARELSVDIERSWMIGDREADIEAAARFGIGSVLVETNQEHFQEPRGAAPTARARTLLEAVDLILKA
jgi:D,D-heptose 1,7-bisphosphate phosphatase